MQQDSPGINQWLFSKSSWTDLSWAEFVEDVLIQLYRSTQQGKLVPRVEANTSKTLKTQQGVLKYFKQI